MTPARHELAGHIAGAGFGSGDRVVVGRWRTSPIGPFADVMWATPDGERVLYAPTERAAAFITAVYRFDRVVVTPVGACWSGRVLDVAAGDRTVRLTAGRAVRVPVVRPAWFTRRVEGPIARAALGVRTYGVSPTGVREWYRATAWHRVVEGSAAIGGRDLGPLGAVDPPCGFGFSEPPRRPSITAVRPLLVDPTGTLDRVVAG